MKQGQVLVPQGEKSHTAQGDLDPPFFVCPSTPYPTSSEDVLGRSTWAGPFHLLSTSQFSGFNMDYVLQISMGC